MSVGVKLDFAKVGDVQRMQCSITVRDTSDVELADKVIELCKAHFDKVEVVETKITWQRDANGAPGIVGMGDGVIASDGTWQNP